MKPSNKPVVIIGAGPAGCAAAIQLVRLGVEVMLIERHQVGGLAGEARCIENLMGWPRPLTGLQFSKHLQRQIQYWHIPLIADTAQYIKPLEAGFEIGLAQHPILYAHQVIIASGTKPLRLEAPGADAARDAGLLVNGLTNAPQDWERIIIIGGGDVGYDYALSLTAAGKQCVLVMRHKPRAIPRLVQQAKEAAIREIQLDLPLEIQCKKGQVVLPTADEEIKADGVIVAIGRAPDDNLIKSLSAVVADEQTGQSNFTGLYLCGSVRRSARERHIHIAAADGLKTAIAITEERNDGATR